MRASANSKITTPPSAETSLQTVTTQHLQLHCIQLQPNGGYLIGAMVNCRELANTFSIAETYPVLRDAILLGESGQSDVNETIAENLMKRTRCCYFHNPSFACNKRKGDSGCPAMNGFNRRLAILGTSEYCIAVHPSEMCTALAVLDASVLVVGLHGERIIPLNDFFLSPGSKPERENVMTPDEFITAIEIPPLPWVTGSSYIKVADRSTLASTLASVAVLLEVHDEIILSCHISLGGVATRPWRAYGAEQLLTGTKNSKENYRAAARAAVAGAKPHTYNAFKIELVQRTLIRALSIAGRNE